MAHTYCSFGSFLSYHNSACGEKSCRRHYRDQSTGHIICVISSCAKMINTQNAIKLNSPFICMMSGKGYLISILSTHIRVEKKRPNSLKLSSDLHTSAPTSPCTHMMINNFWKKMLTLWDLALELKSRPKLSTSIWLHVPNGRAYDPKGLQYSALCSWISALKVSPCFPLCHKDPLVSV